MAVFKDLTGQKFGRLVVIGLARKEQRNNRCRYYWNCQCECGNYHEARTDCLTQGTVRSCGCMHMEQLQDIARKRIIHNMSHTRLHGIWQNMKKRCFVETDSSYPRWGGRGITVCDEWKNDFVPFCEWSMNNGYDDTKTIDRIDNDGNYEPSNCRWTTVKEQCRNRRSNVIVEYNGVEMPLIEASEKSGIQYGALMARYHRGERGEYLFRPVAPSGEKRVVMYEGKEVTLKELSELTGINHNTLKTRYRLGQPLIKQDMRTPW